MSTTDANGVLFYQASDPVSPLHTLLNTGQQSISTALTSVKSRLTTVEAFATTAGPTLLTNATGFNAATAYAFQMSGRTALLEGYILSLGTNTLTTSFIKVGAVPANMRPPSNRYFTSAIFGFATPIQIAVYSNGDINIRTMLGSIVVTGSNNLFVDGISYRI